MSNNDEVEEIFWGASPGQNWSNPQDNNQSKSSDGNKNLEAIYNEDTNNILYMELEEVIYIQCLKDDCIISNKYIYCPVQAGREYYKKAGEILKKAQFFQGNVDPCLLVKKS